MNEHPARAYAICADCDKEGYVQGVVGVSPSTPDGPGEAEFYPEIAGSPFDFCETCHGACPGLEIDMVLRKDGA